MVQLSVSVRSHRVGLLALFATPVLGGNGTTQADPSRNLETPSARTSFGGPVQFNVVRPPETSGSNADAFDSAAPPPGERGAAARGGLAMPI